MLLRSGLQLCAQLRYSGDAYYGDQGTAYYAQPVYPGGYSDGYYGSGYYGSGYYGATRRA